MLKHLRTLPTILLTAIVVLLSGLIVGPLLAQPAVILKSEQRRPPYKNRAVNGYLPPTVLFSPQGAIYECYNEPTPYSDAVPSPEDLAECPPGGYPQLLLPRNRPFTAPGFAPPNQPAPPAQPESISPETAPITNAPVYDPTNKLYRYYVGTTSSITSTGVEGNITVARPEIYYPATIPNKPADKLTLAQIAVASSNLSNAVEIGWIVEPAQNGNDKSVRLSASRYVKNAFLPATDTNSGYKAISGASIKVNAVLTVGPSVTS